jgi:hypothetical protein
LREALVAEGWRPPKNEQARGMPGAMRSSEVRKRRKLVRQAFVKLAFDQLPLSMRQHPYADRTLQELERTYRELVTQHLDLEGRKLVFRRAPFKADREQLLKDVREIASRSR